MVVVRAVLLALSFLLLISGCAGSAAQRGDLMRRLAAMGCGGAPAVEYQQVGTRVVLSASVQECVITHPRRTGDVVGLDEAVRAIGRSIWSSPTYRFDAVLVTVYRTAAEPGRTRPRSVLVERDQLAAEFGPRDPALDSPHGLDDGGRAAWSCLPPLVAVGGVLLVVGTVRSVRAGLVLPILIVRR